MNEPDQPLQVQIDNGIAVLTMNRPERLNALSQQMIDEAIATRYLAPGESLF